MGVGETLARVERAHIDVAMSELDVFGLIEESVEVPHHLIHCYECRGDVHGHAGYQHFYGRTKLERDAELGNGWNAALLRRLWSLKLSPANHVCVEVSQKVADI